MPTTKMLFDANYEVAVIRLPGCEDRTAYVRDERQAEDFARHEGLSPLGNWHSCTQSPVKDCWHEIDLVPLPHAA